MSPYAIVKDHQEELVLFSKTLSLVGPGRVELPTSRLSGVRSNHLSYRPLVPQARNSQEMEVQVSQD